MRVQQRGVQTLRGEEKPVAVTHLSHKKENRGGEVGKRVAKRKKKKLTLLCRSLTPTQSKVTLHAGPGPRRSSGWMRRELWLQPC